MARAVVRRINSWPLKWRVLLSLVVAVGMSAVLMRTVQAVHDLALELDGNTANGGILGKFDWADFFDSNGAEKNPLPADFPHVGFTRDFLSGPPNAQNPNGTFVNADSTTYATGSKDILPISGWQCAVSNNVTDKDDILNAYAAAYTDPSNGDQIIYFGMERNANTGSANFGFWLLQDAVGCVATGNGAFTFTGAHKDGDLLIVSEFTGGGTVSTINVFRWNIPNPLVDPIGSLGGNAVATGVDCRLPTTPAGDAACGAANQASITNVPWLTAAKTAKPEVGHLLPTAQFFEGGLNLTKSQLGGKCFNTFIGNTRSSTELTATLFDFSAGSIGECESETVTTPSITSPTVIPPSGTLNVTDSALVTVDGVQSFTGEVDFFLCGPLASDSTSLCTSGGVAAGTKPVTSSPSTVVSDTMTITAAGRYCWRAEFSASDPAGIPPSSDSRANECFVITPRSAVVDTQAGAGPVDFGQPVTDTATLSNTANHQGSNGPDGSTDGSINPKTAGGLAGGKLTFTLYKNDCTTLAAGTGTNPQEVFVSGDGSYGPVSFTPNAPGTYHWVVSYNGDLPNTTGNSHNTACNDTDESVVVRQIPTEIKTRQSWIPNDVATITSTVGNLANGGSVLFSLYPNATCSGTAVFSQTVSVPGGSQSAEVFTTNTTTFAALTTGYLDPAGSTKGKFSWKVVYTPAAADTAHTGKQSSCDAENFTITYTNDPGPGTAIP